MRPLRLWLHTVSGHWQAAYDRPDGDGWVRAQAVPTDGIFIPRADLPEVKRRELYDGYDVGGGTMANSRPDWTAAEARDLAHRWLALAEHLDANPPVDEAEVAALADAITGAYGSDGAVSIARRLVAAGWKRADR